MQYKTGADGGTILGQPMLFEGMGICILSLAHECEMRDSLVYLLTVKYLLTLFNSATVYIKIGRPCHGFFFIFVV